MSFDTVPSRISTCMPFAIFSRPSAKLVVSWQLRTLQARYAFSRLPDRQWRVSVDMAVLKRRKFVKTFRIFGEHARHVHELGQPDHLWVPAMRNEI